MIEQAIKSGDLEVIEKIVEAAQKMGLLIDDLLSFSRMGHHTPSFQKVSRTPASAWPPYAASSPGTAAAPGLKASRTGGDTLFLLAAGMKGTIG
jgi:hypothetical protein